MGRGKGWGERRGSVDKVSINDWQTSRLPCKSLSQGLSQAYITIGLNFYRVIFYDMFIESYMISRLFTVVGNKKNRLLHLQARLF